MLIATIILLLVMGGGGGFYGYRFWGIRGGAGICLSAIFLGLVLAYTLGAFK